MERKHKIAAVVVLYHPDQDVLANVCSWIDQVELVFAVDNSEGEISPFVSSLEAMEKIVLIRNHLNLGMARALNIGAESADVAEYDFLLTMDQDSHAESDMVDKMLACLDGEQTATVGIISPFHCTRANRPPPKADCQPVMTPMTSGCLLSLYAYRKVGQFRNDLFIDFVDNEYCLRLRCFGFQVIRANRALLEHQVGDTKKYGPFIATNHSSLRRYYKTRNRLLVFREYLTCFPGHCLFDLVRLIKEVASIILFENNKLAKLAMMLRGARDFFRGRFGRYEEIL